MDQIEKNIKDIQENKLFDYINDGFFDWYLDLDYEYMSPRFWEIFGYDYTTKKHHPSEWHDIINKEDLKKALENLDKHIKSKGEYPYYQEVRYTHKQGHEVTVLCKGKIIEWNDDGSPKRMIGTHTDITEIKNYEEELKEKDKQIREKDEELKEKTNFLGKVCHEIRSPLHGIMGSLELIDNDSYSNIPVLKKFISMIKKSSKRLLDIVNNTLSLTRLEYDDILEIEEFDIINLLKQISESYINQNENINVIFDNKIGKEEFILNNDKGKIRMVMDNLVDNACKFTEKGNVKVICELKQTNLIISVKDSGIGIKETEIGNIFKKFYQCEEHKRIKKWQGTGLGLSICKEVCRKIKGDLTVKSKFGEGTIFTFSFPITNKNTNNNKNNSSFLIVDDFEDNLEILTEFLKLNNYTEIDTAFNGKEAIKKIKSRCYDFVLLDVNMPVMNGVECCKTIRNMNSLEYQPVIIMVTAHVVKNIKNDCIQAGCNHFVEKPVNFKRLLDIIKDYE